jgi:hypothetical protein
MLGREVVYFSPDPPPLDETFFRQFSTVAIGLLALTKS